MSPLLIARFASASMAPWICARGRFVGLRGTSHERIQRRGDDLFGGDVVYEEQHPGSQRLDGRQFPGKFLFCGRQFFYLGAINGLQKCMPGRKVAIQGTRSNTCLFGDVIQAGVCPGPGKRLFRHLQDARPTALGIGAGLAAGRLWRRRGHSQTM